MLNGCEVHVAFSGDQAKALSLALTELEKFGYELKTHNAQTLKMGFSGKWITSDPAKLRHAITVTKEGDALSFKFGTGMIASHWTDADKEWAQARAEEVTRAVRAQLDLGG